MRSFIAAREKYVVQYIQSYFDLSDAYMRELGFEV